jgi:hypothetical protein
MSKILELYKAAQSSLGVDKISFEAGKNAQTPYTTNDLKKVDYIITHNVDFHLKTVIAEYVRYNIPPEFFKYKIIDIVSFNHNYKYPKLKDLAENLKIKNITKKTNLELIFSIFFKLIKK